MNIIQSRRGGLYWARGRGMCREGGSKIASGGLLRHHVPFCCFLFDLFFFSFVFPFVFFCFKIQTPKGSHTKIR